MSSEYEENYEERVFSNGEEDVLLLHAKKSSDDSHSQLTTGFEENEKDKDKNKDKDKISHNHIIIKGKEIIPTKESGSGSGVKVYEEGNSVKNEKEQCSCKDNSEFGKRNKSASSPSTPNNTPIPTLFSSPSDPSICSSLKSPHCSPRPTPSLHDEILLFAQYMTPTVEEHMMRESVIVRVSCVISTLWSNAKIKVYGSYTTTPTLCLPMSDIDIAILDVDGERPLEILSELLTSRGIAQKVHVFPKARIPIIKFTDSLTGAIVDISLHPELRTNQIFCEYMAIYPEFRPLALVLKYLLYQRNLHELYNGGMGSYGLMVMIISFLQFTIPIYHPATDVSVKQNVNSSNIVNKPINKVNRQIFDLGDLLVKFFKLYGISFDYQNTAVSIRNGGSYFPKSVRGWYDPINQFLFSVENPLDPQVDLGRASFSIPMMKKCFEESYKALTTFEEGESKTIAKNGFISKLPKLSRILFSDDAIEKQRKFIHTLYGRDTPPVATPLSSFSIHPSTLLPETPQNSPIQTATTTHNTNTSTSTSTSPHLFYDYNNNFSRPRSRRDSESSNSSNSSVEQNSKYYHNKKDNVKRTSPSLNPNNNNTTQSSTYQSKSTKGKKPPAHSNRHNSYSHNTHNPYTYTYPTQPTQPTHSTQQSTESHTSPPLPFTPTRLSSASIPIPIQATSEHNLNSNPSSSPSVWVPSKNHHTNNNNNTNNNNIFTNKFPGSNSSSSQMSNSYPPSRFIAFSEAAKV